jgi:hypothetical protein
VKVADDMNVQPLDQALVQRMIQRLLAPHLSMADLEAICGAREYGEDVVAALNSLLYEDPRFFEDAESRLIDREIELFRQILQGEVSRQPRRYRVRQVHRLGIEGLPERCAVHISLPAPQSIPGTQGVKLTRSVPSRVGDSYLPLAGALHDMCFLVGYGEPMPVIDVEWEVWQSLPDLLSLGDRHLRATTVATSSLPPAVAAEWIEAVARLTPPGSPPDEMVWTLMTAIEDAFQYCIVGPPGDAFLPLLPQLKVGDIQTLTQFAGSVLAGMGFWVRLGGGQELLLGDNGGPVTLHYPGSAGYEHCFLYWRHMATGQCGTADLTYLRRWDLAATESNTRTADFRARLASVGALGRQVLRRSAYPLDMVLSGRPRFAQITDLEGDRSIEAAPPMSTEIYASRVSE